MNEHDRTLAAAREHFFGVTRISDNELLLTDASTTIRLRYDSGSADNNLVEAILDSTDFDLGSYAAVRKEMSRASLL